MELVGVIANSLARGQINHGEGNIVRIFVHCGLNMLKAIRRRLGRRALQQSKCVNSLLGRKGIRNASKGFGASAQAFHKIQRHLGGLNRFFRRTCRGAFRRRCRRRPTANASRQRQSHSRQSHKDHRKALLVC